MQNDIFEVNGVQYTRIEHLGKKRNLSGYSIAIEKALAFYYPFVSSMGGLFEMGGSKHVRKLPKNIDIIKEYGLIQKKSSNLKKIERDMVVKIFESNFKKLEQDADTNPH